MRAKANVQALTMALKKMPHLKSITLIEAANTLTGNI